MVDTINCVCCLLAEFSVELQASKNTEELLSSKVELRLESLAPTLLKTREGSKNDPVKC